MKRVALFYFWLCLVLALTPATWAQPSPVATTPFTRDMLRGTNANAVRLSLGLNSTNFSTVTNLTGITNLTGVTASTNAAGVPSGSTIGTNLTAYALTADLNGASNSLARGYAYPGQFGIVADGQRVYGIATNAANHFYSSSASFTAADTNKLAALFYDVGTNQVYDLFTITSVVSSSHVLLSSNVTATVSNATFWYGTDNITGLRSAALSNSNMVFGAGTILFGGTYQYWTNGEYSLVHFPSHFIRGVTNNPVSVLWQGVAPGHWINTSQSNAAPTDGTIFFSLAKPPASTNTGFWPSIFGSHCDSPLYGVTWGDFGQENYQFERMNFRVPFKNPRTFFSFIYSGNFVMRDCNVGVEYAVGMANGTGHANFIQPYDKNKTNATAIIGPGVSNNGKVVFENVGIQGYPVGMVLGEHYRLHSVSFNGCGLAYQLAHIPNTWASYSGSGAVVLNSQVINCSTVMALPDDTSEFRLNAEIENETGSTNRVLDARTDTINGCLRISYNYGVYTSGQRGLEVHFGASDATTGGGFSDPSTKATLRFSSELGGDYYSGGLVFDACFNDQWNTFDTQGWGTVGSVLTRDSYGWLGTANDTPRYWTNGPVGGALRLVGNNGGITFGTNCCRGLTNFSLFMWLKTANTGEYIVSKYASGSDGEFFMSVAATNTMDYRLVNSTPTQFLIGGGGVTPGVSDGNWHSHGLTYDGATVSVYFDGVMVTNAAFTGGLMASGNTMKIGEVGCAATVGRTRIWNRGLSALEIARLHAEGGRAVPDTSYKPQRSNSFPWVTNGMSHVWNSNGVHYIRTSRVGATNWVDTVLASPP